MASSNSLHGYVVCVYIQALAFLNLEITVELQDMQCCYMIVIFQLRFGHDKFCSYDLLRSKYLSGTGK